MRCVHLCAPGGLHWPHGSRGRGPGTFLNNVLLLVAINVFQTTSEFSKRRTIFRSEREGRRTTSNTMSFLLHAHTHTTCIHTDTHTHTYTHILVKFHTKINVTTYNRKPVRYHINSNSSLPRIIATGSTHAEK